MFVFESVCSTVCLLLYGENLLVLGVGVSHMFRVWACIQIFLDLTLLTQ